MTAPFEETLGDRLRRAMRDNGVRNQSVADAAGVHLNTVSQWLNDRFPPSDENLSAVAKLLGVSTAWLKYGVDRVMEPRPITWPGETNVGQYLPKDLLVMAKQFELEAAERGADRPAFDYIHRALFSVESYAMYSGGYDDPGTPERMRKRMMGLIAGLRVWLDAYLDGMKREGRRR